MKEGYANVLPSLQQPSAEIRKPRDLPTTYMNGLRLLQFTPHRRPLHTGNATVPAKPVKQAPDTFPKRIS